MFLTVYIPSTQVQNVHEIPHISPSLQISQEDFSYFVSNNEWGLYFLYVLPIPILITCVGILLILILQINLISRFCCNCAKCLCNIRIDTIGKDHNEERRHDTEQNNGKCDFFTWTVSMFTAVYSLVTVATILIIGSFIANANLSNVLNIVISSLEELATVISEFNAIMSKLQTEEIALFTVINSNACQVVKNVNSQLIAGVNLLIEKTNYIISATILLPNYASRAATYIASYDFFKNIIFISIFTVTLVVILSFGISTHFKTSTGLKICIALGELLFVVNALTTSAILFALIITADFCMDPIEGTKSFFMPPDSAQYSVVNYYLTACGTDVDPSESTSSPNENSLQARLAAILKILEKLQQTASGSSGQCINEVTGITTAMTTNIQAATTSIECSRINSIWHTAVVSGVCQRGFSSLFNLLILQGAMLVVFYMLMWVASIFYQTFAYGDYLERRPGDVEKGRSEEKVESEHVVEMVNIYKCDSEIPDPLANPLNEECKGAECVSRFGGEMKDGSEMYEVKLDDT